MKGRNIIKKYLCGDINCLSGSLYSDGLVFDLMNVGEIDQIQEQCIMGGFYSITI